MFETCLNPGQSWVWPKFKWAYKIQKKLKNGKPAHRVLLCHILTTVIDKQGLRTFEGVINIRSVRTYPEGLHSHTRTVPSKKDNRPSEIGRSRCTGGRGSCIFRPSPLQHLPRLRRAAAPNLGLIPFSPRRLISKSTPPPSNRRRLRPIDAASPQIDGARLRPNRRRLRPDSRRRPAASVRILMTSRKFFIFVRYFPRPVDCVPDD